MRVGLPALVTTAVVATALAVTSPLIPAADAATTPTVFASDNLNRTVASGLGTASSGAGYSLSSAAAFSVDGSAGRMALAKPGASATATVNGISQTDMAASVQFTLPTLPAAGGGVYTSLQLRKSDAGSYFAQVRVQADQRVLLEVIRVAGSQQTSLANTYNLGKVAAGESLTLTATVSGTTSVKVDAAIARTAKPTATASVSTTDTAANRAVKPGSVAVRGYLSSSTAATSVRFDELSVRSIGGATTLPKPVPTTPTPVPTTAPTTPPVVPTTPPAPTASATAEPTWDRTGARQQAGSVPVGTRQDAIPSGAIIVSAKAAAGGTGTAAKPFAKLQDAVDKAASGSTIVMHAGSYFESVSIPSDKRLTIQAAPKEAVWLDGRELLTGFKASGSTWYVDGYKHNLDSSPTYSQGAADNGGESWKWVSASAPMAAHPDQVWIGGTKLAEVASRDKLVAGTFFVDDAADRLYLGTNPGQSEVRASALTKALSIRGANSTVRGIGIHGYGTSVWMMGTVTAEASGVTLEDVSVYDNSTTGVYATTSNVTLRRVTTARNGLMGIGASTADSFRLEKVLSIENNSEKFNLSPVSGGVKVTRSRGVTIVDSSFLRNNAPGIWMDESTYDMTITGNDVIANAGHGVSLELSQKVMFVNNLLKDNRGQGIKINNTGGVTMWNNTIIGGARTVNIVQDNRKASDASVPGHDPRRPIPDSTMPWLIKDISLGNNVIAASSGNCTICVEDYSKTHAASDLNITVRGGVVQRASANAPTWLAVWSKGAGNPGVYTTLEAFRSATGQGSQMLSVDGKAATAASGALVSGIGSASNSVTAPAAVSTIVGGAGKIGAVFP